MQRLTYSYMVVQRIDQIHQLYRLTTVSMTIVNQHRYHKLPYRITSYHSPFIFNKTTKLLYQIKLVYGTFFMYHHQPQVKTNYYNFGFFFSVFTKEYCHASSMGWKASCS